ncbi:MAG: clostripain-related cysteine peptidase [Vulcanimicrobiota bacterium]
MSTSLEAFNFEFRFPEPIITPEEFFTLRPFDVGPIRGHVILAVLAACNDLIGNIYEDVQEMARGLVGQDSNVAVLMMLTGAAVDSGIFEVSNRGIRLVENIGLMDTNCTNVMGWFLARGLISYLPATRFGVGFLGHGEGFFQRPRIVTDPIVPGKVFSSSLSIQTIKNAVRHAFERTKRAEKLDLLFVDACLCGTLELVAALHDRAEVLAGAETTVPGSGWNYELLLRALSMFPPKSAEDWALVVKASWELQFAQQLRARPLVMASYRNPRRLLTTFHELVTVARHGGAATFNKLARISLLSARESSNRDMVDLLDFAQQLTRSTEGQPLSEAASRLARCYLTEVLCFLELRGIAVGLHGISFWFPLDRIRFEAHRRSYQRLGVPELDDWADYLDEHLPSDHPSQVLEERVSGRTLDNEGDVIITAALPRPADGRPQWVELDTQACIAFRLDGCSLCSGGATMGLQGELFGPRQFSLKGSDVHLPEDGDNICVVNEQGEVLAAVLYGPTEPGEVVRF